MRFGGLGERALCLLRHNRARVVGVEKEEGEFGKARRGGFGADARGLKVSGKGGREGVGKCRGRVRGYDKRVSGTVLDKRASSINPLVYSKISNCETLTTVRFRMRISCL